MKKLLIIFTLVIAAFITEPPATSAQISININIGSQPTWGPVGYDFARFYYFPDLNIYYDINSALFYYRTGASARWRYSRTLPRQYRHYDLHLLYKVVINTDSPWHNNAVHIRNYSRYKGVRSQAVIRDSRDPRYAPNCYQQTPQPQQQPFFGKQRQ